VCLTSQWVPRQDTMDSVFVGCMLHFLSIFMYRQNALSVAPCVVVAVIVLLDDVFIDTKNIDDT